MNKKYEARIFPNGRVVCYEKKDLDDSIEAGKELLIICNCSTGGSAMAFGANKVSNWEHPDETVTLLYSRKINCQVFTGEEMNQFHKVIFTLGEQIFDSNNNYAIRYNYNNHCFYNEGGKMEVDEKRTARYFNREQTKAMIEIGVLTEKALDYCLDAENNQNLAEDSVNCCSGY